jgi:hypothetical protein
MPLRRKHVQAVVLAALGLLVFVPLVAVAVWGLWVSGGGMDEDLEARLAVRLRCRATVRGARPTGLRTAACREVELAWTAGSGGLTLRLEAVTGEKNVLGWCLRAERGALALAGNEPHATLAALNQRLVRAEGEPPVVAVHVAALALDLDLADLVLKTECAALGLLEEGGTWEVTFRPAGEDAPMARETGAGPALAALALDLKSDRGVFRGLEAAFKGVPAARLVECVPGLRPGGGKSAGTFDVTVRWQRPESGPASPGRGPASPGRSPAAAEVKVTGSGLALAEWTAGLPGGPVQGPVRLEASWTRTWPGPAALAVAVESDGGGVISAEALRWLQEALPTAGSCGRLLDGPVGYDELAFRFHTIEGGQGTFHDGSKETRILTRLFGEPVLLLWTGPEPFAPGAVWEKVRPVLTKSAPLQGRP